jgi:hypothetical protein
MIIELGTLTEATQGSHTFGGLDSGSYYEG